MDAHWGGGAGSERPGHEPAPAPGATAAPALPAVGNPPARLGETFQTNPVTGSASMSIPLPFSAGRGAPSMAVGYDSGARAGLFGYGWDLPVPQISRRTDRGLPKYEDADVFLGGGDDLVPDAAPATLRTVAGTEYRVERFRPRVDTGLTRIERWTATADRADCKWRTLSDDNNTAWFGEGPESRIADPADPSRIFGWLISFSHDDKGNAVAYEYAAEDSVGVDTGAVCEAGRTEQSRTAARHLKRVRYGNTVPYLPVPGPASRPVAWLFTLVLDYGDHDPDAPGIEADRPWPARPDPYRTCRPGFEVRTHRLGRRALMFHEIPELGDEPVLTGSVDFAYDTDPLSGDSRLDSVRTCGYVREDGTYLRAETPPLTLHYAPAEIDPTVREVRAENLPAGIDLVDYTWVDLDGDGVAGVLASRSGAWYYLRNRSPLTDDDVAFTAANPVAAHPSGGVHDPGGDLLIDLDGSGLPDLVRIDAPVPGSAARDESGGWGAFSPFAEYPNIDLRTPDLHLADLTGDGLADLLIADPAGGLWCEGRGAAGFGAPRPLDGPELQRPSLLEATATVAVQLADMTGDGLPDLVRIANGSVAFRPNLGYGRFGPAVHMGDSPWFDPPDRFDPRRVLLGDVDGNGRTDLVYLADDGVRLYTNRSGDSWASPRVLLPGVPGTDNRRRVGLVDLRGTGTGCLVWSTSLPHGTAAAMRYVDLMSAGRPHLLTAYENGTGGEVRVEYKPSTYFAQADEQAGRPWPGKLPFPVSCAHRVIRTDRIRETVFTGTTSYHDGYFDPVEREFRGFGRVETVDTEAFEVLPEGSNTGDADLHQPPVLTRTWFHTGAAAAAGERIAHTRRAQYWENTVLPEQALPEPDLPAGLSGEEYRQACRALKGTALRTEVYGLDDGPDATVPYSVNEAAYGIVLRQPLGERRFAVFQLLPTEAITYTYDRLAGDPRIAHSLVLETDDLGVPIRTASLAYGRPAVDLSLPQPVRAAQARTGASYRVVGYTADIDEPDARRLRTVCETHSFELAGLPAGHLTASEVDGYVAAADLVPFEAVGEDGTVDVTGGPVLRLTGRTQAFFRADDLSGPLPFGVHGALGLEHHTRRLTLTDGLVAGYYDGSVTAGELTAAGYEHFEEGWWAPSGVAAYAPGAADHFYLPSGSVDPFGATTEVERDVHDLAIVTVRDVIGHEVHIEHDYRVLAPRAATDPAGNRAAVRFDALGVPVASALLGKPGEPGMDTLDDPTTTLEYDLFAWVDEGRPVRVRRNRRERHGDPASPWHESFAYFDGSGSLVLTKSRVAPGPALQWDPVAETAAEVDADPRWVGNGRTIINNKGLPVKQYDPYFSATHEYESEAALVELGVTAIPRYDPLGRVFRTDFPDGTLTLTETGPWAVTAHDQDDTVLDSAWYAERGSPDPLGPEPADPQERAAWLAAQHAGTPAASYLDVFGRVVYSLADNGSGDLRAMRGETDSTGSVTRQFDARDREFTAGVANLAGDPVRGDSAERGRRWHLVDVIGRLVRAWDEHGRSTRLEHDAAHRPVAVFGTEPGEEETTLTRIVYGDAHPEAAERNLVGKIHIVLDAGGAVVTERYNHKGAPLEVVRRMCADYAADPDWSLLAGIEDPAAVMAAAAPLLEPALDAISTETGYDALGRPLAVTAADGTMVEPGYDEAGRLAELRAQPGGTGPVRTYMAGQEYDPLGRRTVSRYGNGLTSEYTYDPLSRRVTGIRTAAEGSPVDLQHLHFVYEAAGRLVEADDSAQQSLFFNGAFVSPRMRFRHDALGQLVQASGREHAGIAAGEQTGPGDAVGAPLPHPNDTAAVRLYRQEYAYDDLGNLKSMRHIANGGGGWTRHYRYLHDTDALNRQNRLTATSVPTDDPDGPYSLNYAYDDYGNLISAPHLAELQWTQNDQPRVVDLGGGGTAYYCYDGSGTRLRKVVQRQGGLRTERRYIGMVEIYREWMNDVLRLERHTVHLSDETGRFVQIDTLVTDTAGTDGATVGDPVARYQHGNHIGSATLETDEDGAPVSYEEYHPYGSTAYRSAKPGTNHSLKRYRFHGKERDDETGLYHYGARSYAPWLGRWISADPVGTTAGPNLYAYCGNDPSGRVDPNGTEDHQVGEVPGAAPNILDNPNAAPADVLREAQRSFPHLRALPTWDTATGMWVFPEPLFPNGPGEGDDTGDGGGDAGTGTTGTGTGAGTGTETGTAATGTDGTGGDGGTGAGTTGTGTGTDTGSGAGTGAGDGEGDGEGTPGTLGTAGSLVPSAAERFIWNFRFPNEGVAGSRRGQILEWLAGVPWRDNTAGHDAVTATEVRQIKSTGQLGKVGNIARSATRDAASSIAADPALAGRNPRAVIITESDVAATVSADIASATQAGRGRRIPPGALPPEHIRGFPGRAGSVGRALTGIGTALSAAALVNDIYQGDYAMGVGDALGTVGGGLELYALAVPGATVAGASAMTVGLVVGGLGIAVTSGISGYRAYQRGDIPGTVAGAVGVGAGLAIAAGAAGIALGIAGAPVLLAVGVAAAIGVGLYHLGGLFDLW
ncbi:SpvB/TcaC N-terminal domain-containing protein [Glycomyces sp. YM15]|uniref:SpvB/TcaC N-terminal domain-containing protein n=1 Tax=Glycomyces sp. YM15 TaxID=2800446 RepID=UPI00196365EB|nr:SpvB/TcaC N-terminal domain-containing protein [Glycomyces sp. YM15]